MKRFIVNITIFFIIFVISDYAVGCIIKLMDFSKGGEIEKIHSIMTKITPDMVILGSSRASHHYESSILSDSLSLTIYNAGLDGQGTTTAYGILKAISKRRYPRYIICEITPNYDLYKDNPVELCTFYPYANQEEIASLLIDFDPTNRWKLILKSYRLNSMILRLIPALIQNRNNFKFGYQPLYGTINRIDYHNKVKQSKIDINYQKEKYLRLFIEEAIKHNCKILFTISPEFGGGDSSFYDKEKEIINEYGIPIIDKLNDEKIIYNQEYFQDILHMNQSGSIEYTKLIINELRSYLIENYNL